MASSKTIAALNRLLQLHNRSLASYAIYAMPWVQPGEEQAATTLRLVGEAQKKMVDRIAAMILEDTNAINPGEYPMEFTSLHDVSLEYILRRVIGDQKREIVAIERCVDDLRMVPAARALAEEALGEAKGHLESLQEAARPQLAAVVG